MAVDLSSTTIKTGAVLGGAAALLAVGVWIGSRDTRLDNLAATQAANRDGIQATLSRMEAKLDGVATNMGELQREVASLQAQQQLADRERGRIDTDLRLLRDYTEGRVAHLPYNRRSSP